MKNLGNLEKTNQPHKLKNNTYTVKDEIYNVLIQGGFITENVAETNSDTKKYLELIKSGEIKPLNEQDGMESLLDVLRKMNPGIEITGDPTMQCGVLFCDNREQLKLPIGFYIAKGSLRNKHNTSTGMYREYRVSDMEEANSGFYELI